MATAPAIAQGALIFYTTQSLFNTAQPGLPVQDFSSADLYGQTLVTQPNGIDNATSDAVFAAGSILPGLTIGTLAPGSQSSALAVYADSIGNYWFEDTLVLTFAPGVSAVAEDAFASSPLAGSTYAGTITEDIFDGSTPLGSKTLSETAGGSVFFGVSSTTLPITSIQLSGNTNLDSLTFANNIAFGTAAPEPSTFALLVLAATLTGFIPRRRFSQRPPRSCTANRSI